MTNLWHRRCRGFEQFDRITLEVVPRYKTSGLSGDEWRTHVQVNFYFKGELVADTGFSSMKWAVMLLGHAWISNSEPIPDKVIEIEESKCSQPGCSADAVARLKLKELTSEHGEYLDMAREGAYSTYFRRFCKRHIRRGDCSREDSDDNYEPLDGLTADASTNLEESPSAVAPPIFIKSEDIP